MGIFKKKDRRINKDNTVTIPVYGPHDTLQPQDYFIPQMLSMFEQCFEQRCKTWLKNARPDQYNRGYMDLIIDELEAEALVMLDVQSVDHESAIYDLVKVWIGDKIKAEAKLKETQEERKAVNCDIKHLEGIYYKGTAYERLEETMVENKEGEENEEDE